jgi:hypothetical protein
MVELLPGVHKALGIPALLGKEGREEDREGRD